MFSKIFKIKENKKGFTLIELFIVIPIILIIFIVAYNIIFMSSKNFVSTKNNFSTYEDIRVFEINIQKEANQARKATESNDVMEKISDKEIHIYTDINGDSIPELIRYRLDNKEIERDVKYPLLKSTDNQYPYTYSKSWSDQKIVLKNVVNSNFVGDIEKVVESDPNIITQSTKDYRKKGILNIRIGGGNKAGEIDLTILLVTKSRAEAD